MTRGKRAKRTPKKKSLPHCPKCGHRGVIKSGMVQGEQRWKCKDCAYQFTRVTPRGRPLWQKSLVVFLYSYGVSMHMIAKIFQVRPSTVLKWVRLYANDYHTPSPGNIKIMEMQDMRRRLREVVGKDAGMLCIAIDHATFKKSLGITIEREQ